ncbi:MAG: cytochrome d ubiquinol oxidase subunit II [Gammaproteobacteria bacterium RIFCSPHIGHO2_12_FULL_45_9]|nr:MAG: cytochrome d ubiquinol oxidase subunit II [Gammaproteobacteria bacterium RIFCSPHIGHO2_12_FULL_45_9]
MLPLPLLQIIWWFLIGLILIIYASTAGYDAGLTAYLPFLKKEEDKRVVLNISAPTWDGNQTWVVFAGGGLFVVWPMVYSAAFSGLYFAFIAILWTLLLRPPGYDYRSKLHSHLWRRTWDVLLAISGLVPVFLFGVIVGNAFLGFPFTIEPHFFQPIYHVELSHLLNPFGLLCGFISVFMILMHGSSYLARRSENELCALGRRMHKLFLVILSLLFTSAALWVIALPGFVLLHQDADPLLYPLQNTVQLIPHAWIERYHQNPLCYFAPLVTYASWMMSYIANQKARFTLCFWSSVLSIAGVMACVGFALFPFVFPSSFNLNHSLTVWNASSGQYALNTMLCIGVVLLSVTLWYKLWTFKVIWSKQKTLSAKDVADNEHLFY